ncbi:MAG: M28 family metallopeptidase [Halobacteriales archaeon]|nr:M28 family metallopeptidase [Halobacteriales archaeon]
MRTLAVLAVLLLAGLAGCTQTATQTTSTGPAPDPAAYAVPARPKLDAAALLADLKAFAAAYPERRENVPTHEGARQWLAQQFAAAGLQVWRQNFTTGGLPQANLVGIKWGQVRDQWVVAGAHYDTTHDDCLVGRSPGAGGIPTVDNPCLGNKVSQGAYDDGSGTVMAVHLARAFANASTYHTVAFVAYDGEERGLEGATAFVAAVQEGSTPFGAVELHAALDIDMFGITWPGTNAPTQILDNSHALHAVFDAARKEIGMPDDMAYCGDIFTPGSSDFSVYFDAKVPTVFLGSDFGRWTPPNSPAPSPQAVYPNWHLLDTYDTMQAEAGGATQLLQGFQTATHLAAAVLHAESSQPALALDVHAPPGLTSPPGTPCN